MARLDIGPPVTPITDGMNTTYRRQQLPPTSFRMLRNLRISKEAFQRIGGKCRIIALDLPAKSLSSSGDAATFVQIAYSDDGVNVTDYTFDHGKFTIFAAYKPDSLADDCMIASQGTDAAPAFRIVHNADGTISGTGTDAAPTTTTVTTTKTYPAGKETVVWLVRDRGSLSLYVNDDDPVTNATAFDPDLANKSSSDNITLSSWTGRGTGSTMTWYEFRMFRTAETGKEWRLTQYPNTGRFGNPNMVCHLLFEEGTGTDLTDFSRLNNETITLEGAGWTWNSSTDRQTIKPITGIHLKEHPRGRRWLLVDAGSDHHRIPIN